MTKRQKNGLASALVLTAVVAAALGLGAWKTAGIKQAAAASANQQEPMELITAATAVERPHRESTTAIGTALALRSVTLRNEVPGTVRYARLTPGQIVEAGTVLVALDVSVEESELNALEAQAALAQTTLNRVQRLMNDRAAPQSELDRARAEYDVALAQIARTKAVIGRKIIRAPFRARIGLSDVHQGQYLDQGTTLTTLQGVSDDTNIDFAVAQRVANGLRVGDAVQVIGADENKPLNARIVALDARIDPDTRNATIRARLTEAHDAIAPGASVRVILPYGEPMKMVAIPASALRKGPAGDHVFVITPDSTGKPRAHTRLVQTGALIGDSVLILDGLKAGEQVAASGSFKLRDDLLVMTAEQKTAR
ncbi:MAG TPA: efflux RND transporter periplasmic adaptor subunit [Longimicrobiales bacterium]|nr:efflux RND transporter periplasmic adaptor subunit [Longimicrobiales bacterium]